LCTRNAEIGTEANEDVNRLEEQKQTDSSVKVSTADSGIPDRNNRKKSDIVLLWGMGTAAVLFAAFFFKKKW
jgi:hypothetical protein